MNIDNYNAYANLLVDGVPIDPFNIKVPAPTKDHPEIVEKLKELSYKKYGGDRAEIEASIAKRFNT